MTVQKRSMVMIALFAFASILYGVARHYSPALVLFVVEQSLAQKAPSGTDLVRLPERLQTILSAAPDQNARMEKLLRISQYLEKVQQLTPNELKVLLAAGGPETTPGQ
jgi:hypothetical protein